MLNYTLDDKVACISIDDGKANAVGHDFIDALNGALDQAENEAHGVLISGRPGVFSGGFDLKEFQKGEAETTALVTKGGKMLLRLFSHPQPVVAACTGHAVAAGAFMLLASDSRIGTMGDFKIGLNETAIGMALPVFGLQLAEAKLSMRYQTKATIQGSLFDPESAAQAGFLDEIATTEDLMPKALALAKQLAELPTGAYAANKVAVRKDYIEIIEKSLVS